MCTIVWLHFLLMGTIANWDIRFRVNMVNNSVIPNKKKTYLYISNCLISQSELKLWLIQNYKIFMLFYSYILISDLKFPTILLKLIRRYFESKI